MATPKFCNEVAAAVEAIVTRAGPHVVMGLPLGLGKPNQLINALYMRIKGDHSLRLTLYTALSLKKPRPKGELEKKFLGPFLDRVFGGYEPLLYMDDVKNNALPPNIEVHEFYVKSGSILGEAYSQQHYLSTNYSHVPRDLLDKGLNVLAQPVAKHEDQFSLSCNPEITLELKDAVQEGRAKDICFVGQVHRDLPFMENDAAVPGSFFDIILDDPKGHTTLFAPPEMPVSRTDYLIGLYASTLIKDGGTLQLGISSMSDAMVYACKYRNEKNDEYLEVLKTLGIWQKFATVINAEGDTRPFDQGLYGNSEMFVDGLYDLMAAGILKRKVYAHAGLQKLLNEGKITKDVTPDTLQQLLAAGVISSPLTQEDLQFLVRFGVFSDQVRLEEGRLFAAFGHSFSNNLLDPQTFAQITQHCLGSTLKGGVFLHGGFFLGPKLFYERLRNLTPEQALGINMTRIGYVNELHGQETLKRLQRKDARFINTVFKVSLLGAAAADALENGQVVSGVGGQYNFVAQAHALEGARSVLCFKATRTKAGKSASNIVWQYGHTTIPRHLRDIYITEYGIADLRGKSDADCIKAMLNIADSRFQPELMDQAKRAGKLEPHYQIPHAFMQNLPWVVKGNLADFQAKGSFPLFPFGSDFTEEETVILLALKHLKRVSHSKTKLLALAWRGFTVKDHPFIPHLERMQMRKGKTLGEKFTRAVFLGALSETL